MNGWISVKDQLPKLDQEILGYEPDIVYWGFYSQFGFLDTLEECERNETTHWQPIPNPPVSKAELTDEKIEKIEEKIYCRTIQKGKTRQEFNMKFARAIAKHATRVKPNTVT